MKKGMVYLIGAGPGDIDLISVRALRALESADCIVYDFLSNAEIIQKFEYEKIYVGKTGSDHTLSQDKINDLIIQKAKEGKTVARLKGGDPFIFGRGGEEAQDLVNEGIPFRIIPGISSFYSAPAYAGIPVTNRDHADSFEVITGHRRSDSGDDLEITLPEYNPHRTFVFLMGMKNLGRISEKMISEKGFPADTPAAVISWGTTPRQKT
ncbi:MAG TPA: uroporphyrinogen-III C-methyltransferase, partial [Spirochaetota bacterium]|nr:uroporphyrinogen-III C-methyltransferase [Spirochaetota bacterium]